MNFAQMFARIANFSYSLAHPPLKGHEALGAVAQLLDALRGVIDQRRRILLGHLHADGLALVAD